jgi:hypothetical protein
MSMIATYAIAVRSLGDDFEGVRVKASHLAAANACQFWWKPDTSEWHHFIFTNHDVALLFVVYLRSAIIGNNAERIKYVLVTPLLKNRNIWMTILENSTSLQMGRTRPPHTSGA